MSYSSPIVTRGERRRKQQMREQLRHEEHRYVQYISEQHMRQHREAKSVYSYKTEQEIFLANFGLIRKTSSMTTPTSNRSSDTSRVESEKNNDDVSTFNTNEYNRIDGKNTTQLTIKNPAISDKDQAAGFAAVTTKLSSMNVIPDEEESKNFTPCLQKLSNVGNIVCMFHKRVDVDPEKCEINFNGVSLTCKTCVCTLNKSTKP